MIWRAGLFDSGDSGDSPPPSLRYRRGLWHDLAADFPCGVTDFLNGGADFPYGGADCRAANRESSAAIPQSAPVNKSGPPHLKAAKIAKMAAGR